MKRLLGRIVNFEINKVVLTVGMVLLLLVVVAPVARIMMYCVPWYDDFGYGKWVKDFWEIRHSFGDALQGAVESARSSYYAWQGTFSSCFMMSLMPAVWGTDKYVFGLWFILGVFVMAVFALVHVLMRDVLGADRWNTLAVQSVVAATCVLLFHSPIEGLFWYNSGVHYTGMHSIGFLLVAMLLKAVYEKNKIGKIILAVLSVPLAFFVGGANYVTVLQMLLIILSVMGWGLLFKKKSVLIVTPAVISMAVAFCISVTAPGNGKRMVHFTGMKSSPLEAVLNSFKSAFEYLDDFTGWMTLAILILLVPIVIRVVSKTSFEFRYPGLVFAWSFCLYATGFTPTLYTMGHNLLGRATNMTKFTFQLLLFLNLFYITGWVCRYLKEKKGKEVNCKNSLVFYVLMAMLMVGIFAAEPNKGGKYTTYVSYYFVHTGEANNYYREYLERVELCEYDTEDVIVRPYVFKPWVMCLGDLSSDPNYEPNRFMAEYFGKNSISCLTVEEELERLGL